MNLVIAIFLLLLSVLAGYICPVFLCLAKLQDINPFLFTVFTVLYANFYGLVLAFDISDIVNEKMYNFIDVSIDRYINLVNNLFGLILFSLSCHM